MSRPERTETVLNTTKISQSRSVKSPEEHEKKMLDSDTDCACLNVHFYVDHSNELGGRG
jgi:hypothetical protein